jgi:hypothetical protein
MKKIIIAAALTFGVFSVKAQTAVRFPVVAGDTITNTGTVSKILQSTGKVSGVVFQTVLTKLSGTGAGTVAVYGSNDGTNYKSLTGDSTIANVTTQSFVFRIAAPLPQYLKVLYTGSGTESVRTHTYYKLAQ